MAGLVASGLVRRPDTTRYVPDTRLQRLEEASDPQGSCVSYRYSTFPLASHPRDVVEDFHRCVRCSPLPLGSHSRDHMIGQWL